MKVLIYTRVTGGLAFIRAYNPGAESRLNPADCSALPADAINPRVIEFGQLPNREFRDAWKSKGAKVVHDLEKAKGIQLNKIRRARVKKLAAVDDEIKQAEDDGVTKTNLAPMRKKRKALRDITEPLKAMTPKNLQEIIDAFPDELK